MIFQEQLVPHCPEKGLYGDCFRATLASLLGKATAEVPHFMVDNPTDAIFCERLNSYVASLGYIFMEFGAWDLEEWKRQSRISVPMYHSICDVSPRFPSELHSVVGCDGIVVHDPHPTKLGLPTVTENRTFGFLIKLCL